jgi:signal transduction histidine kinase/ligand-binding sensor domain-containing protein
MRPNKSTVSLACIAMAAVALSLCHEAGAVDPNRRLDEYAHAVWKTGNDGLYGQPLTVAQSGDGYLWVGTSAGLFRFDGVRFRVWRHEDGHPFDGLVNGLYSSADGSLWISTLYRGLTRLKDQRVETIGHYLDAFGTMEDRAGVIWFTNYDYSSGKREVCSLGHDAVPHCRPVQHGCYRLALIGGMIWCGGDTGLVRIDHGKQVFMLIPGMESEAGQSGVTGLIPDDHGGLYVSLDKTGPGLGLEELRGNRLIPVRVGDLDGSRLSLSGLFKDREGALWIGTYQGIYRIYKGRVDHLPIEERNFPLYNFAEDREGSIWAVTQKGLERFSDKAVDSMGNAQGVYLGAVEGVTTSRDGTLWVSGTNTLLTLRPGSQTFTAPAKLPPNVQVTSVLEGHDATMWIGIDDSLYTLEAHRLTPVTSSTGKPLGMILSLTEDSAFNLWAVVHGPPRQILKINEASRQITPVATLPPASRVAADPAGGVYVAALNGDLIHVDSHGKERVYPHLDKRSDRISRLLVTSEGTVYASTPFGLETLNNGKLEAMDTGNGLPCDSVYATAVDHSGNIWLYMLCALVRIPKDQMLRWRKDPSAILMEQVFDAEDGVESTDADFDGSAVTPDGTLWFADEGGLQKVDPHSALRKGPVPPVHVEQLVADGTRYPVYGSVDLPPLTRDIQIDYAGLSFTAPDKVRFRYELQGFDENWKDVGPRRQALYTALPPGRYRFRVIASNKDGVWNTVGDSLNFYLAPAFYQTLWFRLLCGAIAVTLLWVIFQLRLRQLLAQARARQSAQYAERERIARSLHDTLLQSVQGLIWRFSAAVEQVPGDLAVRRNLQELLDRSDEVLAEARSSILDLREPGNRSLALAEEISVLGKEAVGNSGIPVTVLTNGKAYELNPDAYENTVLIVREALLNAVRHAKARSLEVQIDYLQHELKICVRDDGQGIDQDTLRHGRAGHWGMVGMSERSKSIHGKLRVLSKAGAGTEIELVVPRAYASK